MGTPGIRRATELHMSREQMLSKRTQPLAPFLEDPAEAKRSGALPLKAPPLPSNPLRIGR